MSLKTATVTAKAVGTITWAFDKVFRTSTSIVKSIANRLGKKNLYDVSICTRQGEVIDTHIAVNRYRIEGSLRSMEDIKNVLVSVETHVRREDGKF